MCVSAHICRYIYIYKYLFIYWVHGHRLGGAQPPLPGPSSIVQLPVFIFHLLRSNFLIPVIIFWHLASNSILQINVTTFDGFGHDLWYVLDPFLVS